jgi:hypothetical protein
MSKKLMGLLKGIKGNISISGDTDNIYVISNIHCDEDAQNVIISGADEELGNVNFRISKDNIVDVRSLFDEIEVLTEDNNLFIISGI